MIKLKKMYLIYWEKSLYLIYKFYVLNVIKIVTQYIHNYQMKIFSY
jgi:hypothetical protein